MKNIIVNRKQIYIDICLCEPYHLRMGKCRFLLNNEIFGNPNDLNYIETSIICILENLIDKPFLPEKYNDLSDRELFNIFREILQDDGDIFSQNDYDFVYGIKIKNMGTFLDDFDVYAYKIYDDSVRIIWCFGDDNLYNCVLDIEELISAYEALKMQFYGINKNLILPIHKRE